jgi:hypothetical protein
MWAGDKSTPRRRQPKWAGHDFAWAEGVSQSAIVRAKAHPKERTPAQRRGNPVHPPFNRAGPPQGKPA